MRGKVNSVSGDNIKFIEKEYDSATLYKKGDIALIRGVLYSCLLDNTTGTLNMDRWKRVYLSDLAETTSSEQALADMVDEVYDPSKVYNKDDTALYNEVLYICKNDGTAGKWNADLWKQTTLVSILNSNLKGNEITKIPGNNRIDAGATLQEMCVLNCEGKSTITFTPIGYGNYGNGIITLSVYGANTFTETMPGNYNISCTDRELIQTINFNSGTEYSVDISGYKYVSFSAKNNNNTYASVDLTHVQLS